MRAGTLRDLSIRLKGAMFRQEQEARLVIAAAWNSAAWTAMRMSGKSPHLPAILTDKPAPQGRPQTPAHVAAAIQHWAAMNGIKAEPFDGPVN